MKTKSKTAANDNGLLLGRAGRVTTIGSTRHSVYAGPGATTLVVPTRGGNGRVIRLDDPRAPRAILRLVNLNGSLGAPRSRLDSAEGELLGEGTLAEVSSLAATVAVYG